MIASRSLGLRCATRMAHCLSTFSFILSLLLLLSHSLLTDPVDATSPKHCFMKTVPKRKKACCCVYCLMLGLNTHHCAGDRYLSKVPLMWLWKCVTIGIYWFPLMIPSPINFLVQSCSHFHKGCGRNILVWLQVTPDQTTKWDNPLVLFGFKPQ